MKGQPRSVQSGVRTPDISQLERVFNREIVRMVRPTSSGSLRVSIPLYTFPDAENNNVFRMGYTVSLAITLPGSGVPANWNGDFGIGTGQVRGSVTALTGDMQNVRPTEAIQASGRIIRISRNHASLRTDHVRAQTNYLNIIGDRGSIAGSINIALYGFVRATYIIL